MMTWRITTTRGEDFGNKILSNVQPQQRSIMDCRRNSDFLTCLIGCDSLIGTNIVWNEETSRSIFKGEAYYICGLPAMVAFMRYIMQSSKRLPGPSKKSIWITCSRTAETWRTSCAEAEATLQARHMFYAHRVYIRQVRAVGLYVIQPP
jgi:hypothetical protein